VFVTPDLHMNSSFYFEIANYVKMLNHILFVLRLTFNYSLQRAKQNKIVCSFGLVEKCTTFSESAQGAIGNVVSFHTGLLEN
jgi:hypothetical protein